MQRCMPRKHYDLFLPYFKQGDDLNNAIGSLGLSLDNPLTAEDSARSFVCHAESLEVAASMLRQMASKAVEHDITIANADVHFIQIECDSEIGAHLVEEGLLQTFSADGADDDDDDYLEDDDDYYDGDEDDDFDDESED